MLYDDYLRTLKNCPFCDVSNYQSQVVSENKTSALIISLAPYQKHHLLIIPKRHLERVVDISDDEISDINDLQKVAIKILYGLNYKDMSILVREGENIGKSVRHLHYHVIPNIMIGALNAHLEPRSIHTSDEIINLVDEMSSLL